MRKLICITFLLMLLTPKLSAQESQDTSKNKIKKQEQDEPIELKSNLVIVPVVIIDNKTNALITDLKKENFTVYEDGIKQEISTFSAAEGPITLVMLLEFSKLIDITDYQRWLTDEIIQPAAILVSEFMKEGDFISIVAFDIRPEVLSDFTGNKSQLRSAINILVKNRPAFRDSNLFDALKFVLEGGRIKDTDYGGLKEIKQRSALLVVATGMDTFSKINLDDTLKIVQRSGVPIYTIGIGEYFFKKYEQYLSTESRLNIYQAQNQLNTFSNLSGGRFYKAIFEAAIPSVLDSITKMIRFHNVLGYYPTNNRKEGKKRKIELKIDLDLDGKDDNKKVELQYRKSYIESRK